jgi:hypothetical protein
MTPQVPGLGSPTQKIDLDSKTVTRASTLTEPLAEPRVWNTKNLGLRLAADFVSGASAATLVAPLITIIDKYLSLPSLHSTQLTKYTQSNNAERLRPSPPCNLPQDVPQDLPPPPTQPNILQTLRPNLHALRRHLPHCQHSRHAHLNSTKQARDTCHQRDCQIRSLVYSQYRSLSLQRPSFCASFWTWWTASSGSVAVLRHLYMSRLSYYLRVV